MELYGGIDLHSNNCVVVLLDEEDRTVLEKRLTNNLDGILLAMADFREAVRGIAVKSTYNWYWLVDGLMDAGHALHLTNTAAVKQYEGLKYAGDRHDARWLAHLLRLGILPEGYIYPKEDRPVRDLLRKRSQLVRQRTQNILSIQNLFARNIAMRITADDVRKMTPDDVDGCLASSDLAQAVKSTHAIYRCQCEEIRRLEKITRGRVKSRPEFKLLQSVPGIGDILAMTILLEMGTVDRFPSAGKFASYCRCVKSSRKSNGKNKGSGNRKNGNRYLSWAFAEAATFAVRFSSRIKKYHQKKKAKRAPAVACNAVAHKLARACYHILRDSVPFDIDRAFV